MSGLSQNNQPTQHNATNLPTHPTKLTLTHPDHVFSSKKPSTLLLKLQMSWMLRHRLVRKHHFWYVEFWGLCILFVGRGETNKKKRKSSHTKPNIPKITVSLGGLMIQKLASSFIKNDFGGVSKSHWRGGTNSNIILGYYMYKHLST